MEPTLAVIRLNYRTSPVAVRERFWIRESGRYEALHHLRRSAGLDEAIVFATCNRAEFDEAKAIARARQHEPMVLITSKYHATSIHGPSDRLPRNSTMS